MMTLTVIAIVLLVLLASTIYVVARGHAKRLTSSGPSAMTRAFEEIVSREPADPGESAVEVLPAADMRRGVGRARSAFRKLFSTMLSGSAVNQRLWDDLEETLLLSDLGMELTSWVIDGAKKQVEAANSVDGTTLAEAVRQQLRSLFVDSDRDLEFSDIAPTVWLIVGVNGVGKTTSIGKLAAMAGADGKRVVLAAADTFRAAAADQLQMWAERTGADIVRSVPGADPSSVVYDSIQRAAARGYDLVIADTAGRLHTKSNLMDELRKLRRTAEREPAHLTEVLLVLDATTGQNGLIQAREFAKAAGITGLVLTKLDGSAKGGIALAAERELGVPIKLVGVGEKVTDLILFSPDEFLDALLEVEDEE